MKRLSLIACILLALSLQVAAQEVYNSSGSRWARPSAPKQGGFDPQKMIYGGGFWLSFGSVTSVYVAPVLGYRFTDRFAAGVGLAYQYLHEGNVPVYNPITGITGFYDYDASVLTPSAWARFLVFQNLFLHAEFEQNFISYTDVGFDPNGTGNLERYKTKYQFPALLLGGGYRQPMTENSSLYLMALYDVIQDPRSPYYRMIDFRIGFNIGF